MGYGMRGEKCIDVAGGEVYLKRAKMIVKPFMAGEAKHDSIGMLNGNAPRRFVGGRCDG